MKYTSLKHMIAGMIIFQSYSCESSDQKSMFSSGANNQDISNPTEIEISDNENETLDTSQKNYEPTTQANTNKDNSYLDINSLISQVYTPKITEREIEEERLQTTKKYELREAQLKSFYQNELNKEKLRLQQETEIAKFELKRKIESVTDEYKSEIQDLKRKNLNLTNQIKEYEQKSESVNELTILPGKETKEEYIMADNETDNLTSHYNDINTRLDKLELVIHEIQTSSSKYNKQKKNNPNSNLRNEKERLWNKRKYSGTQEFKGPEKIFRQIINRLDEYIRKLEEIKLGRESELTCVLL